MIELDSAIDLDVTVEVKQGAPSCPKCACLMSRTDRFIISCSTCETHFEYRKHFFTEVDRFGLAIKGGFNKFMGNEWAGFIALNRKDYFNECCHRMSKLSDESEIESALEAINLKLINAGYQRVQRINFILQIPHGHDSDEQYEYVVRNILKS